MKVWLKDLIEKRELSMNNLYCLVVGLWAWYDLGLSEETPEPRHCLRPDHTEAKSQEVNGAEVGQRNVWNADKQTCMNLTARIWSWLAVRKVRTAAIGLEWGLNDEWCMEWRISNPAYPKRWTVDLPYCNCTNISSFWEAKVKLEICVSTEACCTHCSNTQKIGLDKDGSFVQSIYLAVMEKRIKIKNNSPNNA